MRGRIFFLALLVGVKSIQSATVLVVPGFSPTQPAINDAGEIVYVINQGIVSTTRGHLVQGVDASNIGLSNSGEVVWASGSPTSVVTSTVRGVLVGFRSAAPSISPTTGEVGFLDDASAHISFNTTTQGKVENFSDILGFYVGVGDVNDSGEVVFELEDTTGISRIYSTARGFISPIGINAIQPSINNFGEVVWSGYDGRGEQEIFSSVRGQLTFFGGPTSFFTADLPDINNQGDVVFRGVLADRKTGGLFVINSAADAPSPVPLPMSLPFGIVLLAMIIATHRWRRSFPHTTTIPTASP